MQFIRGGEKQKKNRKRSEKNYKSKKKERKKKRKEHWISFSKVLLNTLWICQLCKIAWSKNFAFFLLLLRNGALD